MRSHTATKKPPELPTQSELVPLLQQQSQQQSFRTTCNRILTTAREHPEK